MDMWLDEEIDDELIYDDQEICAECTMNIEIGQVIATYGGELFCDEDCVAEWLLWEYRNEIKTIVYE